MDLPSKLDHQSIRERRCADRFSRVAIDPGRAMQSLPGARLHLGWYTQSRQESSDPDHRSANERAKVTIRLRCSQLQSPRTIR